MFLCIRNFKGNRIKESSLIIWEKLNVFFISCLLRKLRKSCCGEFWSTNHYICFNLFHGPSIFPPAHPSRYFMTGPLAMINAARCKETQHLRKLGENLLAYCTKICWKSEILTQKTSCAASWITPWFHRKLKLGQSGRKKIEQNYRISNYADYTRES